MTSTATLFPGSAPAIAFVRVSGSDFRRLAEMFLGDLLKEVAGGAPTVRAGLAVARAARALPRT